MIGVKKNKNIKHRILLIGLLFLVPSITACSKDDDSTYAIYYKSLDGTRITSSVYSVSATDTEMLANELVEQMNTNYKSDEYTVIKPDNVEFSGVTVDGDVAKVHFSNDYYSMDNTTEVLLRAATVKTLCQVDGINSVVIFAGTEEAVGADGRAYGQMHIEDFVDRTDNSINNLEWTELTLYFANSKGDKLLPEKVKVAYSKTMSIEKLIVTQLIKGPDESQYQKTLPANLKLIDITVSDGVCFVNFDSAFMSELINVADVVEVYSIVNSLCQISYINSVKILIDGEANKVFRDSIDLSDTFMPDYSIVEIK